MSTTEKKRPHGLQEYRGNGQHDWELVVFGCNRLRVPGGWLYNVGSTTTFVPMPEVVNYVI